MVIKVEAVDAIDDFFADAPAAPAAATSDGSTTLLPHRDRFEFVAVHDYDAGNNRMAASFVAVPITVDAVAIASRC